MARPTSRILRKKSYDYTLIKSCHTCVIRLLDLDVPIEQVNYHADHKSRVMTKRYEHANAERYRAAIEALGAAGKTEQCGGVGGSEVEASLVSLKPLG